MNRFRSATTADEWLTVVTALSWEEPIFKITKYIKVSGTFVWPSEKLGISIETTASEFEHLISFCKQGKNQKIIVETT